MKKSFFFLVLMCLVVLPAVAQVFGNFELESNNSSGKLVPALQTYFGGNFQNSRLGWAFWALASKGWSEAYPMLTWSPIRKENGLDVQIGGGAGIESNQSRLRYAGFVSVTLPDNQGNALFFYENGAVSTWWRGFVMKPLGKYFQAGIMGQDQMGFGPKVEFVKKPFGVWTSILFRPGQPATWFISVKYVF